MVPPIYVNHHLGFSFFSEFRVEGSGCRVYGVGLFFQGRVAEQVSPCNTDTAPSYAHRG